MKDRIAEEGSEMRELSHYRRPFLAAERIINAGKPGRLELSEGSRNLVLSVEAGDADSLRQLLEQLCQPDSDYWIKVRERHDPGLVALVDQLDRLGWVREADYSGSAGLANEAKELRELVQRARDWLQKSADCVDAMGCSRQNGRIYAKALGQFADAAAAHLRGASDGFGMRALPDCMSGDMAALALSLMLYRWRRTSPLTLRIVHAVFRAGAASLDPTESNAAPDVDASDAALADPSLIGKQVWAATALAALSAAQTNISDYATFTPSIYRGGPGLNILAEAEAAAERLMLARGPSPLLDVIGQSVEVRKVAVGVYLHEYLITIRYIEAIHAFLQNNLRADLRAAGTSYLLEEVGHEVHELAACRELGVLDDEIGQFAPLPFFWAYPEVLGAVAELDPLAFCLAVTVAEGLPGTTKPIVAALAKRGVVENSLAAHQAIDERLDHTLMTRRLMRHVPWVGPASARRAIQRFLSIVELSNLCWRQFANYAQVPQFPAVPVAFGMSAADLLTTTSRT
jgi:hypothetical protein